MQKRTFLKSALALGVALSAAPILTACSKAEPEKQAAAQAPAAAPAVHGLHHARYRPRRKAA